MRARPIVRRRLVLALDLAVLAAVGAGTAAVIRSFDLPPLPGMAPVIGQAWGPWSPLPFWLILLVLLAGLAPLYLLATGRARRSDDLIGWVLTFTFSALLGPVFGWIMVAVSGGASSMTLQHYQTTFEPLLYGVGLAVVLAMILKETGPAARRSRV